MLANKLFPLLAKPEVQELILLTGKPPCALVSGSYRRLSAQTLRDEDIMAVVMAARGQEHAAQLADGVRWEFVHSAVGRIHVLARYEGDLLRMSLRLADPDAARSQQAVQAEANEPSQLHRPRQAAEPSRQAAEPSRQAAEPSRQAAEPSRQAAEPSRQAAEPSRQVADAISVPPPIEEGAPSMVPTERSAQSSPRYPAAATEPRDAPAAAPARSAGLPDADAARAQRGLGLDDPWSGRPREVASTRGAAVATADVLDELFSRAREQRASDLHILADRPATLRIAGDLVPQPERLDAQTLERLLLARVPESLRAILERDGSCDFALHHPACGRFRANVGRQRTGLKLTARPIGAAVPTLEQLGLPASIASALEHHQGLIVITGPTGHGKTTTLASLVGILNRETSHHVITVEDPIEYVHPTAQAVISQREVGTHTKTFAAALKGALREDPDVIVVGELRDTETVRMALSASETGHLVISTMNTPSAAKAIERLIDLFPPGDQPQVRMTLAGGLRLIISQRLVPSADRTQLCAAAEVLPGSTPLWNLIRDNRTYQIASLQQRGKSLGIVRLDDSLAELVRSGRTTLEIAREYADSPELLLTLLQGKSPAQGQARAVATRAEPLAENSNDPDSSLQKRGVELGKQVLSRAGKIFGGESK